MLSDEFILTAVIFLVVVFFIWILIREVVCWYYKINDIKDNQTKIIDLLSSIDSKLSSEKSEKIEYKRHTGRGSVNDLYSKHNQ